MSTTAVKKERRSLPLRKFDTSKLVLEFLKSSEDGVVDNLYSVFSAILRNYKLDSSDIKIVAFMKSFIEVRRHVKQAILKGEQYEDKTSEKGISLNEVMESYANLCTDIPVNVLAHLLKVEEITGTPVRNSDNHWVSGNTVYTWDDELMEEAKKLAAKMKQ